MKGHTMIELLITLTIISIIAGMLLSSVSSVTRQARRTECRNFQRQLKIYEVTGGNDLEISGKKIYLGGILVRGDCYECHPSIP